METENLPAVLVVEDDPIIRMDAVATIEDAGLRAYGAKSADDGIRVMEKHEDIGIMFTDIDMPGSMDGIQLSFYVRDRWPSVRILVASGAVQPRDSELPDESMFFPKPYAMYEVIAAIIGTGNAPASYV